MKILIIGATGFIGRHLASHLLSAGHKVIVSSRNPDKAKKIFDKPYEIVSWDGMHSEGLAGHLEDIDAIVNLSGAVDG